VYKFFQLALFCLFYFFTAFIPSAAYDDDWYDTFSQPTLDWYDPSPQPFVPQPSVEKSLPWNNESQDKSKEIYPRDGHRRNTKPLFKELRKYKESLKSFYQWDTALNFSVALGLGATLANTSCDGSFRNWYQDNVRSSGTDDLTRAFKPFGEGFLIPVYVVTSVTYRYIDEYWELDAGCGKNFGEWASRSSRAILVGFPPLLLGQNLLGASRPNENVWGSQWKPFSDDNGISGHAFLGTIPFITAAQMTDRIWLKSLFYFGSTLTLWNRINDDSHYLSQVILGWYLAYLSCRAVTRTEIPNMGRGLTVFPLVTTDTIGVGIMYRR
jgi:membrane-associated phospholipid phosphatase